ncbi:TonB-linked SusC/RagA family outer membrane protein [Pedobacter sp. AK017]|uniref:SusC/RagA family TonB-linked outer membrane protein n=1 Tax=Pedobacter sp. AK017 TaxID=2723073 RepID=UPI0016117766|nr:SusC/RagA family TonB-linked outer membrane protein [Pedobacter sp. AK017]MBB5440235.1 TonB-linked SusC/RagA family outer membrane protein [Pedobacter sp. AK017]
MKLVVVILFTCLMQVSASTFAQRVTLNQRNATLEKVLKAIRLQTGYNILYDVNLIKKADLINLNVQNVSVEEAIEEVLKNQRLTYKIEEKNIIIKPQETTFLERPAERWAAIDITGRVVDESGNPLPGATVKVKDGKSVTMTDAQGRFLIEKVNEGATIVISYTGYQTVEITAKQNMGSITLKLSDNPLDQVQIIAYGTTSRRFSVSNNATVTAKEIENQPVNNPLLALQGRVPGLEITQANGIPGGGVKVRIQGRNNINPNLVGSDPLIVIDGVPFMSQNLSTFLGGSDSGMPILGGSNEQTPSLGVPTGNPLAFINPSDIESIDILKDADATAIYGSRAANGAILITTKRGKIGPMRVNVNLQQGWGNVGHFMELLNGQQFMEMRREAKANDGATTLATDYDLRGLWDTSRNTDWQKELIGGTAKYSNFTAGVSGGNQTVQYFISSTFSKETSVFPGDFDNTSGSLHFNVSAANSDNRLKIQLGGSYMHNVNRLPGIDYTRTALLLPPVAPNLFTDNGVLNWAPDPQANGNSSWVNPLSMQYNLFDTKTGNLVTNASISYRILNGLEVKSTFGFTNTISDQFLGTLNESVKPELRADRQRAANFGFNKSQSWIVEPQLSYTQALGKGRLSVLTGSTFQQQLNEGRAFLVNGQPSDQLLRNMASGATLRSTGIDIAQYRYSGVFARVGYVQDERYMLSLTARRDGSSRFGANNQMHNFGSIGLGWILSEEGFFKKVLPFISFAKLRGSYGFTGNDQLGNYRFMNLYTSVTPSILYQGQPGLEPLNLPNPNLEWELTKKMQLGLDMGIIKDRFLFTLNYTLNRSSNNLTDIALPHIAGFPSFTGNLPAVVQNRSWEFSLMTENIQSKEFHWSSSVNLTIPHNKLLAFPGLETSSLANFYIIGQSLNIARNYAFVGVDSQMGTFLIADRYGNPTSNPSVSNDRTSVNQTGLQLYGGLQNNLTYKGVKLEIFIQFTRQNGLQLPDFGAIPGRVIYSLIPIGNQPLGVMQRWQKPGDISLYQRFTSTTRLPSDVGDRGFGDISYARIKNVSVSYQFPSKVTKWLSTQSLRVYLNSQNLLTITKYRGLDPETLSYSSLPPLRMITAGIQATF